MIFDCDEPILEYVNTSLSEGKDIQHSLSSPDRTITMRNIEQSDLSAVRINRDDPRTSDLPAPYTPETGDPIPTPEQLVSKREEHILPKSRNVDIETDGNFVLPHDGALKQYESSQLNLWEAQGSARTRQQKPRRSFR